jgi:hypothetical protein
MDTLPADYFSTLRKYETAAPDTVIRRYLTAEKFERFVQNWALRFAPASEFRDDPEEGFFTVQDQVARENRLKQMKFCDRGMNIAREAWDTVSKNNAKAVVISCWTRGQAESARMWEEYGQSKRAVAIETTLGALRAVLGRDVIAAPVQYIDREYASLPEGHSVEPFLFKGKDFEWENELRFVASMEIGRRLGTPRMFILPADKLDLKIILHPQADQQRMPEIATLLGEYTEILEIRPSTLLYP